MDLSTYPNNFACQKPLQEISSEAFNKLLAERHLLVTKKYNGNRCHILVGPTGKVQAFSIAGTLNWTGCIPNLIAHISSLQFPCNSFIDGEIYIPVTAGQESTEKLQRVINAGSDEAGALAEQELKPQFAIFDVIFWNGQEVYKNSLKDRLALLQTITLTPRVHLAETVTVNSFSDALAQLEVLKIEGFVAADLRAPHNVNFNGNVKRGKSYKIKLRITEEFIAEQPQPAAIASLGVGTVAVFKRKKSTGKLVYFGRVGSFDLDFDRIKGLNPALYPCIIEVSHFGVDERNNLTFPKALRVRTDVAADAVEI